jgi:hypothetical protein
MKRVQPLAFVWLFCAAFLGALLIGAPSGATQVAPFEGVARGFPELRDSAGQKLADGDFAQWIEGERLHVKIRYDFDRGRRIEENAVFRQRPQLVQEEWSFREDRDGQLYRHFEVDFRSGTASARKREENELEEWTEKIEVEAGRSFAGFGFTLAIKALRTRLVDGETIELQAIGFTPKPRIVSVELSHGGVDQIRMGGRMLRGDRFIIHPNVPWFARLFVKVPDTHIWLTTPPPAGFLRWEGPLAEPSDSTIRVDLLPGGPSGPAKPQKTTQR